MARWNVPALAPAEEMEALRAEVGRLREIQSGDMNDLVLMGMARDEAYAEREALRAENARLRELADRCSTFFRVAMPKMTIAGSWLDADAIDAWNKAALAIEAHDRARAALSQPARGEGET